jgi:nucleotide-binding universal stress UspA family protein
MFKNILAATDCLNALDTPVLAAAKIAEQKNAKVYILHVLESADVEHRNCVQDSKTGQKIDATSEYKNMVREQLDTIYAEIFQSHIDYEIKVTTGLPSEEITKWSDDVNADLLVLGSHSGRAEEKEVVQVAGKIGSTAAAVMAREHCPAMIVSPSVTNRKMTFKNIMIGIDFSVACECALCFAVKLAQRNHAKLFVFHMMPVPALPSYAKLDYEADVVFSRTKLEAFCHSFVDGTDHEYHIRGGRHPHLEILGYAEKKDVDLIVMGSHTRTRAGQRHVGSCVENVSLGSNCPVIVVKHSDT